MLGKRDFDIFAQGVDRPFCRVSCKSGNEIGEMARQHQPGENKREIPRAGGFLVCPAAGHCFMNPA